MKRLIGALTIVLGFGVTGLAHAAITGSSHDFTDGLKGKSGNTGAGTAFSEAWNDRKEICRVCHVPHDHSQAEKRYEKGLLWNHALSSANYTMYDVGFSKTLTGSQSSQPDGTAKLCLGCHDGTVAIDTFDRYAGGNVFFDSVSNPDGTTSGSYSPGYKVPGYQKGNVDLRGTHPISIAFPAAEIGDGKNFTNPAVQTWTTGGTVASTLDDGKVQCSTCHDVHSQEVIAGTHLLRAAQTVAQGGPASGLCLTCHVK